MLVLWTTLLADIPHKEEPVTPRISFYTLRQSTLNISLKISVQLLYCFPQNHRSFCLVEYYLTLRFVIQLFLCSSAG